MTETVKSPIPEGMPTDDYHALRDALWRSTYNGGKVRQTTVIHTARGWSMERLAALEPPYEMAPMQFIIQTKGTPSGFANLGWNPIVGQTAAEAFEETMIPLTRLVSVIYQRKL